MKTKEQTKSKIKKILIFIIFLILFINITIIVYAYIYNYIIQYNINHYINYPQLESNEKKIDEKEIINLVSIDNETFKNFKENFIGNSDKKIIENNYNIENTFNFIYNLENESLRKKAEINFKIIETYISDRNDYIYSLLLNNIEKSGINENELDKLYASVCSGMLKNHLKLDNYTIELDKKEWIMQYKNSKLLKFSVNNKFLVYFIYDKDCISMKIFLKTKNSSYKPNIFEENIKGYNELKRDKKYATSTINNQS